MSDGLEHRVARLEAIEACKNVKRRHVYLADSGYPPEEMAELWCDDGVWLGVYTDFDNPVFAGELAQRQYRGKEELKTFWRSHHQVYDWVLHINVCPIIKVADDLKSAHGKWIFMMPNTRYINGEKTPTWMAGLQTDTYRKENGVWKFDTVRVDIKMVATHADGWAESRYLKVPPI